MQRFVDASAIGWYHYLYGDNSKANTMIKDENPDITDDQIAFSIAEMKKYGVVNFGDTFKLGIGAMTDARWKDFFDKMVETGMVAASADYKKAYTLQFVDKGVGLNLRPQRSPATAVSEQILGATRHQCSKALADASSQEAGLSAQAHHYRQARLLCRSPAPDHARDRASLAQGLNNRAESSHLPLRRREWAI